MSQSKKHEALNEKWCIMYSFSVFTRPPTKKLVWLYLYSVCIFSIKKIGFEYKNWIQLFGVFFFSKMNTVAFL